MKRGSRIKNHLIILLVLFSTTVISIVVGALYFQLKSTIKFYNDKIVNSSGDIMLGMMKTTKEEGEKIILSSNEKIIDVTKEKLAGASLKMSEKQNNALLKVFSGLLNQYMESYEIKLGNVVTNPAIYWKKEEASRKILRDVMARDSAILGFMVYTETVDPFFTVGEIKESYNYKEMVKQVRNNQIYISNLHDDDTYYIGTQILNEDREVKGYIVARIDLSKVAWKIINSISDSNDKVMYITNGDGKIIKHQNPKYDGSNSTGVKAPRGMGFVQTVSGNNIYNIYRSSYRGINYVIFARESFSNSFEYVDSIKTSADETIKKSFDEFDKKLKNEIGKSYNVTKAVSGEKLNDFIKEFVRTIIIVAISGILISIIIGIIIANKVTEPVKELSFAAKKIGEGKLDYKIDPKLFRRRDELGELAFEFLEMKDKLKADIGKITNLERRKANAERLSMMGQMVSGIVHEIKNPLTSISGFAQIIEEITPDQTIKKHTRTIMEETERLNKLARDLLGYAKTQDLIMERVRVRTLLEGVTEKLNPKIREKMVHVKIEIPETLPSIYGDKDRLTQVFINLISNSVEAMRSAGGIVELSAEREGDRVVVRCRDNGAGIPRELQDKLFMPFVSGKKGGTGLGLALVKKIIEDHDGEITLGKVEKGTEFIIKLPMRQENNKE